MIDFHTHILPCMDDGSDSVATSVDMLEKSARAGVEAVVATPHFYAEEENPVSFLKKRQESFTTLIRERNLPVPRILLGAEVYYFDGICNSGCVADLCINGSDLIMIEMPIVKWTQYMLSELYELGYQQSVTVIIAHIERYMDYQSDDVWNELRSQGILMQVNSNFFIRRNTRSKALSMLERGEIDLLGSDCHDMTTRLPNMDEAMRIIEAQYGKSGTVDLASRGRELLLSHRTEAYQA